MEKYTDNDVLSGKPWKFSLFGTEKTLKPTGFIINRLMREVQLGEAQLQQMPMVNEKDFKAILKKEGELEVKLKEFVKMTIEPCTEEELENVGMEHFTIISKQVNRRGQMANGWSMTQIIRAENAEIEQRVVALEEGKLDDFLERIEKMQKEAQNL